MNIDININNEVQQAKAAESDAQVLSGSSIITNQAIKTTAETENAEDAERRRGGLHVSVELASTTRQAIGAPLQLEPSTCKTPISVLDEYVELNRRRQRRKALQTIQMHDTTRVQGRRDETGTKTIPMDDGLAETTEKATDSQGSEDHSQGNQDQSDSRNNLLVEAEGTSKINQEGSEDQQQQQQQQPAIRTQMEANIGSGRLDGVKDTFVEDNLNDIWEAVRRLAAKRRPRPTQEQMLEDLRRHPDLQHRLAPDFLPQLSKGQLFGLKLARTSTEGLREAVKSELMARRRAAQQQTAICNQLEAKIGNGRTDGVDTFVDDESDAFWEVIRRLAAKRRPRPTQEQMLEDLRRHPDLQYRLAPDFLPQLTKEQLLGLEFATTSTGALREAVKFELMVRRRKLWRVDELMPETEHARRKRERRQRWVIVYHILLTTFLVLLVIVGAWRRAEGAGKFKATAVSIAKKPSLPISNFRTNVSSTQVQESRAVSSTKSLEDELDVSCRVPGSVGGGKALVVSSRGGTNGKLLRPIRSFVYLSRQSREDRSKALILLPAATAEQCGMNRKHVVAAWTVTLWNARAFTASRTMHLLPSVEEQVPAIQGIRVSSVQVRAKIASSSTALVAWEVRGVNVWKSGKWPAAEYVRWCSDCSRDSIWLPHSRDTGSTAVAVWEASDAISWTASWSGGKCAAAVSARCNCDQSRKSCRPAPLRDKGKIAGKSAVIFFWEAREKASWKPPWMYSGAESLQRIGNRFREALRPPPLRDKAMANHQTVSRSMIAACAAEQIPRKPPWIRQEGQFLALGQRDSNIYLESLRPPPERDKVSLSRLQCGLLTEKKIVAAGRPPWKPPWRDGDLEKTKIVSLHIWWDEDRIHV